MHAFSRHVLGASLCALILPAPAIIHAQVVPTPHVPVVGSSNPASPEPPFAEPYSPACTVPLLTEQAFADFNNKPITYSPPSGCPGPWARVVFSADFTVTAGRQYDRTAKFFLGGANIYFGTTAEPRATLSPSWHVERDVTDLSALFHTPQVGQAILGNFVGTYNSVVYDGIIYANARLQFYPVNSDNPAATVPDQVLGFPSNNSTFVNTTTDQSTGTFTFPRNLESLYLDVISQSQASDEFWYFGLPNNIAAEFQDPGNTAFRETEVTIDGRPAGVAPVYPWIYTGGIDPYIWEPIPGVETLSLKPYRVNLTPFAGLLVDGKPHTVAVSVFNADSGFDVASTLLLYVDHNSTVVTGGLFHDTLGKNPSPKVSESLNTAADGTVSGTVSVTSSRSWNIAGFVDTSHGRVQTVVQGTNSFGNLQDLKLSPTIYKQDVTQSTEQHELVTTKTTTGTVQTQHDVVFPLIVNYNQAPDSSGNYAVTTYVKQGKYTALRSPLGPNSPNPVVTNEQIETTDTLHFSPTFSYLGHDNDTAQSTYSSKDAQHNCFYRALTAVQNILTGVQDSTSCSLAP